ncbi:MAG: dTMP kinase [Proteobacteria bacterium]|nr:dTMP kinase [Pseudomonadota bacterium]
MTTGKFITFEGGEGAGKSTQVKLLAERLRDAAYKVVETREPGGTRRGEEIREFLLSGEAKNFGPMGEAVLFSAARAHHLNEVIRPALERGDWVLCDRFSDSTAAYQGAAGGVKPGLIRALERVAVDRNMPDMTFILDLPPEVGLKRTAQRNGGGGERPDRFEAMDLHFHEALRAAFLRIAEEQPRRCIILDALQAESAVAEDVWEAIVTG